MRVKYICDFAGCMLVFKGSVLPFFCFCGIGIHSDKTWDEREIVEDFSRLPPSLAISDVAGFLAVGTFSTAFVFAYETTAAVYATVILDRLQPRKEL